jgi:hypothetical protein
VRFTEEAAREAIAASRTLTEALRRLGLRAAGGNHATLKRHIAQWNISTAHFDAAAVRRQTLAKANRPKPLHEVMVENSTYSRSSLKHRLLRDGIKRPVCELCGQGEYWHGRLMSLILDHINGVATDHRLENLRIVCPNCAATLDTHCGRANVRERLCVLCDKPFRPRTSAQRHCSKECGIRASSGHGPRPSIRKVVRPPYAQLIREVHALGWSGVGHRYGVSDNAVRKWVRQYERERSAEGGRT